jgi:hypothetical protein
VSPGRALRGPGLIVALVKDELFGRGAWVWRRLSWRRGWKDPYALVGFSSGPPRYRPRLFFNSSSGRGLRFAVSGVFTGRLGFISGESPVGETVEVSLGCAGRNFIVGPDPPISFPFTPFLRGGPPRFAPPRRPNQRAR